MLTFSQCSLFFRFKQLKTPSIPLTETVYSSTVKISYNTKECCFMEKVFASPSRYVQGKDVFKTGLSHVLALGNRLLLLCDPIVYDLVGKELEENLVTSGATVYHESFNGEASNKEVSRVAEIAKEHELTAIVGLGGGKTIDTAKAIADDCQCPVAILPTVASTDAPTSALSVIYSPEGVFERYRFYTKNPELVLIDTNVIAHSPVRLLVSGIADALATWVEARAVIEAQGKTMVGDTPTIASEAIARACEATLFENGLQALAAANAKVVTPALEKVVEANTLLSGIGFESAGLAAAHAIHNGFTALHGDIHTLTHGEKVAYGTLTQLLLENRPKEELDKYITFYKELGLPTTLKEVKLDTVPYEDLLKIGRLATQDGETIHQMVVQYTAEDVANALIALDQYVTTRF